MLPRHFFIRERGSFSLVIAPRCIRLVFYVIDNYAPSKKVLFNKLSKAIRFYPKGFVNMWLRPFHYIMNLLKITNLRSLFPGAISRLCIVYRYIHFIFTAVNNIPVKDLAVIPIFQNINININRTGIACFLYHIAVFIVSMPPFFPI